MFCYILFFLHFGFTTYYKAKEKYYINECLVWSCSVSINNCKSESVKLSPEATLKVTNGQTAVLIGQTPVPNIN